MKKTFSLHVEGKHPDRVMDAIKHDVRKYVRRERRKALPAGIDYWDFACRFGLDQASAQPVHLAELTKKMDEAVAAGATAFYVEILATPGVRGSARATGEAAAE